jgi:hypothetical protein
MLIQEKMQMQTIQLKTGVGEEGILQIHSTYNLDIDSDRCKSRSKDKNLGKNTI